MEISYSNLIISMLFNMIDSVPECGIWREGKFVGCADVILNFRKLQISSNGNKNPDRNDRGYCLLCKSLQMVAYRVQMCQNIGNFLKVGCNNFNRLHPFFKSQI